MIIIKLFLFGSILAMPLLSIVTAGFSTTVKIGSYIILLSQTVGADGWGSSFVPSASVAYQIHTTLKLYIPVLNECDKILYFKKKKSCCFARHTFSYKNLIYHHTIWGAENPTSKKKKLLSMVTQKKWKKMWLRTTRKLSQWTCKHARSSSPCLGCFSQMRNKFFPNECNHVPLDIACQLCQSPVSILLPPRLICHTFLFIIWERTWDFWGGACDQFWRSNFFFSLRPNC